MKIFFPALLLMFMTGIAHASSHKVAENRIKEIEAFKSILVGTKNGEPFSPEEMLHINSLYSQLEKDEYSVSTRDGSLSYSVDEYDIEETLWPVRISAELFDGNIKIDEEINLLYSNMMERQYILLSKMTEYQRRDYEYSVSEYENKFRAGKEQIHIEVIFKIQHWNKASQYRFKPEKIVVWKIAKKDRIILSLENMNAETWTCTPAVEFRTRKEIESDSKRTKKILYAESRASKEKEYEKKSGRRAIVFFTFNME